MPKFTIEEEIDHANRIPIELDFHNLFEKVYNQEKNEPFPLFLASKMYYVGKIRGKREERQRRARKAGN